MAEHTPGPWRIEPRPGSYMIQSDHTAPIPGRMPLIENVAEVHGGLSGQGHMDALLIAAAPDMLTALHGLLDVVNVRIDDPRIKQFDAARAAVAKAEGRTL